MWRIVCVYDMILYVNTIDVYIYTYIRTFEGSQGLDKAITGAE